MGLDQNWLGCEHDRPIVKSDHSWEKDGLDNFAYHRKFNALEGFMQTIWYRNGNTKEFNCELLPVDDCVLDELEAKIDDDELEPTSGFFFGSTKKDEWYRKDIKELKEEVIPKAREYLEKGGQVYYTSWY